MKYLLLPLTVFFTSSVVCSQTGYNILYSTRDEDLPAFMNRSPSNTSATYSHLVFNDTVAFYYSFPFRKDPMKESKEYGSKVIHHAQLFNLNTQMTYSGVAHQLSVKKRYYLSYPLKFTEWIYQDAFKTILGYPCKKAFITKTNLVKVDTAYKTYTDSTIVWYTEQIKLPFGPLVYCGLPGVVLEAYDQRSMGRHIIAKKIETGLVSIAIPATIDIIPVSETKHGKRRK